KYFRGTLGTAEREWSLRQVIDRVADTITDWGIRDGYFVDTEEADAFRAELKYLLVYQRAAFNSPVWFNIGVKGVPQQASACFILAVDDTMNAILNWYREEGVIFKGGSGAGVNLSKIRSSKENLEGGGTASGPVSFMRGADASAGTIKSGGKTRRAAKMVILDIDHPDVEEFIWCKAKEERKVRVLEAAGYDMSLNSPDWASIQYQNANNSIRVTDAFMHAVEAFEHAVDTVFLAQEILVGYSSYPTPEIERNAKAYRQLGLGYANLGALLMARGLPYDSDEGRAYAAAVTALMTGRAYRKSAEVAGRMGSLDRKS